MTVARTHSLLYSLARFLGDYQAVKNGRSGSGSLRSHSSGGTDRAMTKLAREGRVSDMLSDEQAREVDDLRSQLRRVRAEIHAWPDDNATYRSLLADMRELQRLLDKKLPPATDSLSSA